LEAAVRLHFVPRDRTKALADALDRVQKLLYGMRREKLRGIGASVAGASMLWLAIRVFG
jgi:transposase-like protein